MLCISIDGACRRNGKPDCTAAGGVFVLPLAGDGETVLAPSQVKDCYEYASTSQRGELLALITALDVVIGMEDHAQIITDSEYLFNTMTKEWYKSWPKKGWLTSTGNPVKNRDLWERVIDRCTQCDNLSIDITFYHIKGHAMSFGTVTASSSLDKDSSGLSLYEVILHKIRTVALKDGMHAAIMDLSKKNNGFCLPDFILQRFVVMNTMADAIATRCVDIADASRPIIQP